MEYCASGTTTSVPVPKPAYATPMALLMRSRNQRLISIEAGTMPSMETPIPRVTPTIRLELPELREVAGHEATGRQQHQAERDRRRARPNGRSAFR